MAHARMGVYARWFCKDCTSVWYQGRFPCTKCCGFTASACNIVRGVLTAHGKPNARCLP